MIMLMVWLKSHSIMPRLTTANTIFNTFGEGKKEAAVETCE